MTGAGGGTGPHWGLWWPSALDDWRFSSDGEVYRTVAEVGTLRLLSVSQVGLRGVRGHWWRRRLVGVGTILPIVQPATGLKGEGCLGCVIP